MVMYGKICEICGREFETNRKNAKYCNGKHMKVCENCGKEYDVHDLWRYHDRKFCSRSCRDSIRKIDHLYAIDGFNALEDETFLDIPGFDGSYLASNFGRVLSLAGNEPRLMSCSVEFGNAYLNLYDPSSKTYTNFNVTRFVANNFVDNPNHLNIVKHIVDNLEDNRLDNLYFAKKNRSKGGSKCECIAVDDYGHMKVFKTISSAASYFGLSITYFTGFLDSDKEIYHKSGIWHVKRRS